MASFIPASSDRLVPERRPLVIETPGATGEVLQTQLVDSNGDPLGVTDSALDIRWQDQFSTIVDLHLTRLVQTATLVTATAIDDLVIRVTTVGTPVAGSEMEIMEGSLFYQGEILNVAAAGSDWDLTMDSPLDAVFSTSAGIEERDENLAVDGSTTPVTFSLSPGKLADGQEWDITRMAMGFTGGAAGDDGKFGCYAALTNGMVFRSLGSITKNLFNAKDNSQLALHTGGDVTYQTRSGGGGGTYGVRMRRTFSGVDKNGSTIRLRATTNDEIEIIVQDDLTAHTTITAVAQGHVAE